MIISTSKRSIMAALCAAIMLAGFSGIQAQERPPRRPQSLEPHGPLGPRGEMRPERAGRDRGRLFPRGFNFISSEMRFGEKVVKGVPYSAQATIETSQILGDGTRITHKIDVSLYRDAEGRTRREQALGMIGPLAAAGDAPQLIFINDVVAGVLYVLNAQTRTARKLRVPGVSPPHESERPDFVDAKTESLGTMNIEGVEAEGTRSTITVPAGEIGNDRPIEIISERWYSQSLQAVVLSKHGDPRFGENIYRLANIKLGEPTRSLFEVPSDYTFEDDLPAPRRRRINGRRQPPRFDL